MDVYCPVCGEPWENDSLHEEGERRFEAAKGFDYAEFIEREPDHTKREAEYSPFYKAVLADFRSKGCQALATAFGPQDHCKPGANDGDETDPTYGLTRSQASAALFDIMGDDIDGVMSGLDDLRL